MDADQLRAIDLIHDLVSRTGLSPSEIAREAGIAPSTLTRLYPIPSVKSTLSSRTLSKLMATFPETGTAIETKPPSNRVSSNRVPFSPQPRTSLPLFSIAPMIDCRELPVGAERLALFTGNLNIPVGLATAHVPILHDERFFAIYMPDESMEPRYRPGEVLVIDRLKPPSSGSDAMIEFSDSNQGSTVTIAHIAKSDRSHLTLLQYRYDTAATIHRSTIKQLFSIAGSFDD